MTSKSDCAVKPKLLINDERIHKPTFGDDLVRLVPLMFSIRRAKLGQIQGGLQRVSQDSTIIFYALKISLFKVFTLSG